MAFASNKPLYLLHMDLCGPMRVQSINGKRYVLVVVDDYSRYTWVFFLHSKDEASDVIISFIKKTQVNLQLQVQRVRTDNGTTKLLLSSLMSHSKLNKDVKRYSRKDLLSCNNSRLEETSSAYVCNDAMNVSCNSMMYDLFDENNFFIFDDESVRISPVSKMPFRKKPHDSLNIVQICLWIIDLGCSKHMTGNRALLTNFMEKFLETVRFGNNDFMVIAGYGDDNKESLLYGVDLLTGDRSSNLYTIALNEVASNSSTYDASEVIISFIKKTQVNLQLQVQCVRTDNGTEFKNKTLAKFFDEVGITQKFSATRTPQQNGVVEKRNRTLVEAARTMLKFANLPSFLWAKAIATACFTQNRLIIHKRFDKTPYELMNKRKPNIKFFRMFGCRCYLLNDYKDVGKLKAKGDIRVFVLYSKESTTFIIYNKRTHKIHEIVNVNFDEISEMTSKQFCLEPDLSNLNKMGKSSNPSVKNVKTVFLNGILKEEVYVGQPPGFVSKQYPDHVFALDKSLYGLKQAPQAWYDVLSQFLIDISFQKGSIDTTLLIKKKDLMVKPFEMSMIGEIKPFEMSMIGEMKFFLGLQVNQFSNRIFINQSKYILDILKRFRMKNCDTVPIPMVEQAKLKLDLVGKPVDLTDYQSMIGSLMMSLRSKKYTWKCSILGDKLVCWSSKKQNCVSIAESEYVAVSSYCAQVLWMRTQLTNYGFFYDKVPIYCDSKSAIAISCNPVQHTRTKHNDLRMLVAMPFHNLEFCDSNDSPFGIYIASRFPINSETVELLTFTPPVRDSPKGVLVIVYWLLYPHSPRYQVFNPLDMPVICCLRLRNGSCIFAVRSTSSKILEVVVDEVCKWNNTTTSVVRLLPSDIRALSDFYMTPSSIHMLVQQEVLESMYQL
nr:retrotransposon protein, putative, unclassified [Tanacetum cinerariifolium]